jgi:hypothetical protein
MCAIKILKQVSLHAEEGDCYKVRDPKRGFVFKGSTRTLQGETLEEY